MATGADDRYWERQGLPSVFKHDLLKRYLPQFGGKTGSKARGVVYLDGYAGRGRYEDKTPGSAEQIMQIAEQQGTVGIAYRLFFYESDQKSYAALKEVVDEYVARGLRAEASDDDVITGLPGVITAAEDKSLFLFLDPCGLGLPFTDLTATLSHPGKGQPGAWGGAEGGSGHQFCVLRWCCLTTRSSRRREQARSVLEGERPGQSQRVQLV